MKKLFRTLFFFFSPLVFEPFYFELKSFLGRIFQRALKVDASNSNFINLGCGPVVEKGMINIDFFFEKNIDYAADLRYPLRIPDNCIDGIISEHTFEHLTYESDEMMFKECYRILKPGGTFRIILPNVDKFVQALAKNDQSWIDEWENYYFVKSTDPVRAKRRLKAPLQALSFVMQEYGHVSAWDPKTLQTFLENAGFTNVRETKWKQGAIPELLVDTDYPSRKFVSMYVEATK